MELPSYRTFAQPHTGVSCVGFQSAIVQVLNQSEKSVMKGSEVKMIGLLSLFLDWLHALHCDALTLIHKLSSILTFSKQQLGGHLRDVQVH